MKKEIDKEGQESPSRPSVNDSDTKVATESSNEGNDDEKAESESLRHKDSAHSMERFANLNHHYIAASNTLTENYGFDDIEDDNCESGAEDAEGEKAVTKEVEDDPELGTAHQEDESKKNTHTFLQKARAPVAQLRNKKH
ncbi:hypothetical protein COOONC_26503 [Cooperia oncophora]